jgi:mannose-1-phosphate guanylyltransferase
VKSNIKCILMAAGLGTRLRPLTLEIPKCLLPIKGKPLLDYWLEDLIEMGISDVLINTHWLPESIASHISKYDGSSLNIVLANESVLLGSGGTIIENKKWIGKSDDLLIIYADNYTRFSLQKMVDYYWATGSLATIGVFVAKNPRECGIFEVSLEGGIVSFEEKPKNPRGSLAAAGIYIFSSKIIEQIIPMNNAVSGPIDIGFDIIPMILNQCNLYKIEESIIDIGDLNRYYSIR